MEACNSYAVAHDTVVVLCAFAAAYLAYYKMAVVVDIVVAVVHFVVVFGYRTVVGCYKTAVEAVAVEHSRFVLVVDYKTVVVAGA